MYFDQCDIHLALFVTLWRAYRDLVGCVIHQHCIGK